jgi:hypothetical protein
MTSIRVLASQCETGPRLMSQTPRYIDDLLRVRYPLNRDQIVNLRGDKDVDGQRLCPPQTGGDPINRRAFIGADALSEPCPIRRCRST